jgi:hypothetical protein
MTLSPEELASRLPGFRLVDGSLVGSGRGGGLGTPKFGPPQTFASGVPIPAGFWINLTSNNRAFVFPGPVYLSVTPGQMFVSDGTVAPDGVTATGLAPVMFE